MNIKIGVLLDSLDLSRQAHSDAGKTIVASFEMLKPFFDDLELVFFTENNVESFLGSIDDSDFSTLVLSSNSIRHPDSIVAESFNKNVAKVSKFVENGGGLLVLHQFQSNLDSLILQEGPSLGFEERSNGLGIEPLTLKFAQDVLLNFPYTINLQEELAPKGTQLRDVLSWMRCAKDEDSLLVILESQDSEPLMSRTRSSSHHKIVLCAIPLDWHGATALLANSLCYATAGEPERVLWFTGTQEESLNTRPQSGLDGFFCLPHELVSPETGGWLSSQEIISLSSHGLDPKKVMRSRGAHLHFDQVDQVDQGAISISGSIGLFRERTALSVLEGMDFSSIGPNFVTQPYPLRNIVQSLTYLATSFPMRNFWDPRLDSHFKEKFVSLEFSNMTVTSAFASLQTTICLSLGEKTSEPITKRIRGLLSQSVEDALFEDLIEVTEKVIPLDKWLVRVAESAHEISGPVCVRLMEWTGFLIHNMNLPADDVLLASANQALITKVFLSKEWPDELLSIEGVCSLVSAISAESSLLSEQKLTIFRLGLLRLRRFLELSQAPSQMTLRVRSATSVVMAEQRFPDLVGQTFDALSRSFLGEFSRSSSGVGTFPRGKGSYSQLSEQVKLMQDKNTTIRLDMEKRQNLWFLGSVIAWAGTVGLSGALVFAWLQIFQFEAVADIFALPLGLGVLWISYQALMWLDRNSITPRWASRLLRRAPWFKH